MDFPFRGGTELFRFISILPIATDWAKWLERIETIRAHLRFSPFGRVFGENPGRNFVRTRTVQGQSALF
jgi:hypothetical protein